jgi:hypothetical protein
MAGGAHLKEDRRRDHHHSTRPEPHIMIETAARLIDTIAARHDHCCFQTMRRPDLQRPENVPRCREVPRPPKPARWLLPAVLGFLTLLAGDRAGATTGTVSRRFDAGAHRQLCRCHTCRGESCCCGREKSDTNSESRAPAAPRPRRTVTETGPCLASAPCGGESGLPDAPPGASVGKAVQDNAHGFCLDPLSRFLSLPASERLPLQHSSRLEEPPEPIG